jgi:hypothetical protein
LHCEGGRQTRFSTEISALRIESRSGIEAAYARNRAAAGTSTPICADRNGYLLSRKKMQESLILKA